MIFGYASSRIRDNKTNFKTTITTDEYTVPATDRFQSSYGKDIRRHDHFHLRHNVTELVDFSFISFSQGPFLLFGVGRDEWIGSFFLLLHKRNHQKTPTNKSIEKDKSLFQNCDFCKLMQDKHRLHLLRPHLTPNHLCFLTKSFSLHVFSCLYCRQARKQVREKLKTKTKPTTPPTFWLCLSNSSSPWSCLSS